LPKGYRKDGQPRRVSPEKRCAICQHPERVRIEALHVAGVSLDKIAAKFDVHRDAVWRHVQRHMTDDQRATYLVGPARIAELREVAAAENESVLDYLSILRSALVAQLDKLSKANDHQGIATISTPLLNCLKALGKVTGEINAVANSTIINVQNNNVVLNSPPFNDMQAGLMEVCAHHPAARADIVALFRRLDEKYSQKPLSAPPMRQIAEASNAA
jgi:hypothetical protein